MALVVPNVAERTLLNYILNKSAPTDVVMHLYTNNVMPDEDTALADLTEATEAGYAAITLSNGSWTVSTTNNITSGSHPEVTFSFTENVTAFGYYVTDNSGADLLWLESFETGSFSITSGSGTIKITPQVVLD